MRKKNYKYCTSYKDDDHKIKPLRIMLRKKCAYEKIMMDKPNGSIF